jgi:2,3-bisphosphoglycerate-independent phosphoglycerate mutase
MDGIGWSPRQLGNAVYAAKTPNLDRYAQQPLWSTLKAHGSAIGMPTDADMGNSEVGHNILGAGRTFDQGAKRVQQALDQGDAFNGYWQTQIQHCKQHRRTLHLLGLLSDGNVHSHIQHLFALIHEAHRQHLESVAVHILLDGRDVERTSALHYVEQLETLLASKNRRTHFNYRIASGGGRMHITMDRYGADWPMVEKGFRTHVHGDAPGFVSATAAILAARSECPNISDQDLPPFVVCSEGQPVGRIQDGDALVIFNFRGDRVLQICECFEAETFSHFQRGSVPKILFSGMTLYDGDTQSPKHYLVPPPHIDNTLSETLCQAGKRQLAVAETQKFGHITYFWNGNRSGKFSETLEDYIEIPSLPAPFDANPAMRANEITQNIIAALPNYPFLRLNLANGDMVGHTGNFAATIAAVETVDRCLGQLEHAVLHAQGSLIVTADHGNADEMFEFDHITQQAKCNTHGEYIPRNSHSLNPVPFAAILPPRYATHYQINPHAQRHLGNIANTVLVLLGFMPHDFYLPGLLIPRS